MAILVGLSVNKKTGETGNLIVLMKEGRKKTRRTQIYLLLFCASSVSYKSQSTKGL